MYNKKAGAGTRETFDIVFTRERDPEGIVRPDHINPGCQGLKYEDVHYAMDLFGRTASEEGYKIEIIRKIHVWCHECRGYIGWKQIPFKEVPYDHYKMMSPPDTVEVNIDVFICKACGYRTAARINHSVHLTH